MAIRRKRRMTAAQKAALAKGRKKLSSKRKTTPRRKSTAKRSRKRTSVKTVESGVPMARKRRKSGGAKGTSRKATSRRRRSGNGGVGKFNMMNTVKDVGLAVGGGILAGVVANKLPIPNPKLKAAAPLIAGVAMMATIGRKNKMVAQMATGVMVLGAVALIRNLFPAVPLLAGEEEVMVSPEMLGYVPEGIEYEGEDDDLSDLSGRVDLGEEELYITPANV